MRSWSLVLLACCTVALSCWLGARTAASDTIPAAWLAGWLDPDADESPARPSSTAPDRTKPRTGDVHLLVSAVPAEAVLVDADGTVRHRWSVQGPRWAGAVPRLIGACVLPGGDLIAIVNPHGALARLDRESNIVWVRPIVQGRTVTLGPDGSIWVVARHLVPPARAVPAINRRPINHEDILFRFSPDGEQLQRMSILDCLLRSDQAALAHTIHWDDDPVGTGSIRVLDPPDASRQAFFGTGTILLALEHLHAIALIDPARECVTWATSGPWKCPTDAQLLSDGVMLVYDSRGRMIAPERKPNGVWSGRGTARVIEYDLVEGRIRSRIDLDIAPGDPSRGLATRLDNGHTLIVHHLPGLATELDLDGRAVGHWRFPSSTARRSLVACTRLAPETIAWLDAPAPKGTGR